jgi:hypothetical protein
VYGSVAFVLAFATGNAYFVLLTPYPDTPRTQHVLRASYVEIRTSTGCGSGTWIHTRRGPRILTAWHVVEGAESVDIRRELDGSKAFTSIAGEVESHSETSDIAVIRPACVPRDVVPITLRPIDLSPGETCWYMGTPDATHGMLERSIINRLDYHDYGAGRHFIVNGNGWFGNSGCGVYVERGGLAYAGMLVAGNPNVRYCICVPVERIIETLSRAGY